MTIIEFIDAKPPQDKLAAPPAGAGEAATAAEPASAATITEEPAKSEG
jgi:hypothetical protein